MPVSGFLALLDDIATVLDDVALLTKVAAKKTAGVLGDDLALNAEQVTGVLADRELPVVWGVFKGSLVNKAILVPAALAISAVAPWAVTPLLMVGGLYLCYEGFEKIAHKLLHPPGKGEAGQTERTGTPLRADVDLAKVEKEKIKGAVRTDFVLSAEIVAITLGTVASSSFATRLVVLAGVAVLMTVGVYGLVAAIVKLDDLGLHLGRRPGAGVLARLGRGLGAGLLGAAPHLMRFLSVAGTVAMFLVGGGILVHGLPPLHHLSERLAATGGFAGALAPTAVAVLAGVVAGGLALAGAALVARVLRKRG